MTLWLLTHPAIANRKAEDSLGASPIDGDGIAAREVLRATTSVRAPTRNPHEPSLATSGSALPTTHRAPTAIEHPDTSTRTASTAPARATPPVATSLPRTASRPHRRTAVAATSDR